MVPVCLNEAMKLINLCSLPSRHVIFWLILSKQQGGATHLLFTCRCLRFSAIPNKRTVCRSTCGASARCFTQWDHLSLPRIEECWSLSPGSSVASSSAAAVEVCASDSATHQSCSHGEPTADCAAHIATEIKSPINSHVKKTKQTQNIRRDTDKTVMSLWTSEWTEQQSWPRRPSAPAYSGSVCSKARVNPDHGLDLGSGRTLARFDRSRRRGVHAATVGSCSCGNCPRTVHVCT